LDSASEYLEAMNYIGSKVSLLPWLEQVINSLVIGERSLCDLFSGTGAVAAHFKRQGWQISANDLQYYSFVLLEHLIATNQPLAFEHLEAVSGLASVPTNDRLARVCEHLSQLPGRDGFITDNYCLAGTTGQQFARQYFSDRNGRLIDDVRATISEWHDSGQLNDREFYAVLASLLESADRHANTASVYAAFLKHLKASAAKPLVIRPIPVITSNYANQVFLGNANDTIRQVRGNVLYLDPPYNQRQYANYYQPTISGKTGMRDYSLQKSAYSSRRMVVDAFADLIEHADFQLIVVSYNNEGLMSVDDVEEVLSSRGRYGCATKEYTRFKADRDAQRTYQAQTTTEYLHYCQVR
jgi:adenine-specific DNA-methyltransferase